MKKKVLFYVILLPLFITIGVLCINSFDNINNLNDKKTLSINDSNLNDNAKDDIREYNNETGEILVAEKSKENLESYVNPTNVAYLDNSLVNSGLTAVLKSATRNISLPYKYDLRDVDGVSYVTPFEQQFGETCWAYAITGVIESKLLRSGLESDPLALELAERMIDYAVTDPSLAVDIGINPYFGYSSIKDLNEGGSWDRYASVLINGLFPINERDWNYDKDYLGKVKPEDIYDLDKSPYQVNEIISLTDNNLTLGFDEDFNKVLKQYIMDNGSVAVELKTSGRNSVYFAPTEDEPPLDQENPDRNILYYRDSSLSGSNDHQAAIIGWNDSYHHEICVREDGIAKPNLSGTCTTGVLKEINGAWIVKNSTSGDRYIYLAYETARLKYVVITDISLKNWNNSYQSGLVSNKEVTFTKMNTKEKLESIKLYNTNVSELQGLKIYVDSLDGNSSQLVATFSAEHPGMYTIDIPGDIILSESQFKVKISGYYGRYSVFTSSVDEDIEIMMDDAKIENSIRYQSLLGNYGNLIVLTGISRNLSEDIDYIIKDNSNIDVTNKFNISRNYSAGNYINSIIRFNNDVELGEYTAYAYVGNQLYDTFKIDIDYYMEVLEGNGTEETPYLITNPAQLDMVRLDQYAYYKLENDIDLTYDTQNENGLFYNNGLGWDPIAYDGTLDIINGILYYENGFSGLFDGNNKKITGLYINRPTEDCVGLFKNTQHSNWERKVTLKNIILENVDITGKDYVGALIGYAFALAPNKTLVIENIAVSGSVKGNNYVGGIIGYYLAGLLTSSSPNMLTNNRQRAINLFNSATIESNNYSGGIVGLLGSFYNYNYVTLQVYNWQNSGTIISDDTAGGLVGKAIARNEDVLSINNSINTGKVIGINTAGIVYSFEYEANKAGYQDGSLILNNIYYVNDVGYVASEAIEANNVQKYSIIDLTQESIYDLFTDFNTFYNKETINNINRIPFLKIVNPEYTNITDITLNNLNTVSIYDYISGSRDVSYVITDDEIASINNNGDIIPNKAGSTTIQVTSNYDGYTKAVPLVINVYSLTISFNANGGIGTMEEIEINLGETLNLPNNGFTKEGYSFKEWNTKEDGTGVSYNENDQISPNSNLTLYAYWEANEITVTLPDGTEETYYYGDSYTFGTNDVVKANENVATVTFKYQDGETADTELNVIKSFTPNGWLVGTTEYADNEILVLTEDIEIEYNYIETITSPVFPEPTREHYTFDGWYDLEENGNVVTSYTGDQDINLYAYWTGEEVTVTLPDWTEETYNYGDSYTFGTNDVVKANENVATVTFKYQDNETADTTGTVLKSYTPNGWLVGTTENADNEILVLTEDIEIEYNYIETITSPIFPDPIRDNYEFNGWFDAEEDGNVVTTYTGSEDISLYAYWTILAPTDFDVDANELTLLVGGTHQIVPTFIPAGTTDTLVYSEYDNEKVSVVDGLITGLASGETTIKVSLASNSEIYKTISVTIISNELLSGSLDIQTMPLGRIVIGEDPKTALEDFLSKIGNPGEYIKLYDMNDELVEDFEGFIKTGMKVKLLINDEVIDEAYVVVRGDLDGDGYVDASDGIIHQNIILEKPEYDGYKLDYRAYAADLDYDPNETEEIIIDATDGNILDNKILEKIDSLNH